MQRLWGGGGRGRGELPKEYQDMIRQESCTTDKLMHDAAKDYVIGVVS